MQVESYNDKVTLIVVMGSITTEKFSWKIGDEPQKHFSNLLNKAQKFINGEKLVKSRKI